MKLVLVVVAALSGACGQVLSPYEKVGTEPPNGAEQAIGLVRGFYASQTGAEIPQVTVHWVSEPLYDNGIETEGLLESFGFAMSCDEIYVYSTWKEQIIHRTALAHEIAHCACASRAEMDQNHINALWWDTDGLVFRARDMLEAAGL